MHTIKSFFNCAPIHLHGLKSGNLNANKVTVSIARLDQVHSLVAGNKFFKLKYNFLEAAQQEKKTLVTMGGRYSNHLLAVARAGKACGFQTIGIVRGDDPVPLNAVLKEAESEGMRLVFVTREDYRTKQAERFLGKSGATSDEAFFIPEGGTNQCAVKGVAEMAAGLSEDYDVYCCPCGTAGTVAGLAEGLPLNVKVLGFSVLKDQGSLKEKAAQLVVNSEKLDRVTIIDRFCFGGYGKTPPDLLQFCQRFQDLEGIWLDPIYTGKMMQGLCILISEGYFEAGTRILALNTAGFSSSVSPQP
ncbi:MAG: pyridoxal-phosphate dependent enzyme [Verrucomicrobiota bacterium]|nr:pyridoxal-phosphate dependent enzyme [Verrucomicrobiota bacterium]